MIDNTVTRQHSCKEQEREAIASPSRTPDLRVSQQAAFLPEPTYPTPWICSCGCIPASLVFTVW